MNQELYTATALIWKNIDTNGLYRYDPSDIEDHYFHALHAGKKLLPRKFYRTFDVLFPLPTRKILRIAKTLNPSTYYHLGMARLELEQAGVPVDTSYCAKDFADMAIERFYDPETGVWRFEECVTRHTQVEKTDKAPSLQMHYLARLNIFLLKLWQHTQDPQYLEIASKSCIAATKQHFITRWEDGAVAISYYYNTKDNTLNVNSEYLQWLSEIPQEKRTPELEQLGHDILQMLLTEQNEDGSFYYFGKEYAAKTHKPATIDHHHTAYMLANLIFILKSGFITEKERPALLESCVRGMEFYLDKLFHTDSGIAITDMHLPNRIPATVPYSEGLIALCAYLTEESIPSELRRRIQQKIPKMIKYLLTLIDRKDGSMPSACIGRKWVKLDSIRWGNGVALQAFAAVLHQEKEGLLSI